jgi:phage gpG-like protein
VIVRDFISPGLRRIARKAEDPKPVLEAMGLQLASIAARSFNNPSLRVVPWPALKPSTVKEKLAAGKSGAILKRDLLLWRSWVRPDLTHGRASVTIKSDRPYAAVHQFGSTKKRIPARPMLPFIGNSKNAKLAPFAREKLERVGRAKLNALLQAQ